MKAQWLATALLALAHPAGVAATVDCPLPVRVEALDRHGSVVETGSGFVASQGRTVITAAHVIDQAHAVRIETPEGITRWARAVERDKRSDVARIVLRGRALPGVPPLRAGPAHVGSVVETIGHVPKLGFVAISNRIRATSVTTEMGTVIETDAPWVAGISGAPIVGPQCRVIGLASFGTAGPVPHYYAIPALSFARWLEDD